MQVSTNPEIIEFAYSVTVALILLLISVVGYLLVDKFSTSSKLTRQKETEQKDYLSKLGQMLDSIKETVSNLSVIVEVIKTQQEERDPRMENKLYLHTKQIAELYTKVTEINTFCEFKHNKKKKNEKVD